MSQKLWPWLLVGGGAFAAYKLTKTVAPTQLGDETKKIGERSEDFDPREEVLTVAIPFDTFRELDIVREKGDNPARFFVAVYGPWTGVEEIGLSAKPSLGTDKFLETIERRLKEAGLDSAFEVSAEDAKWDNGSNTLFFIVVIDILQPDLVITNGIRLDPSESEAAGLGNNGAFILEYQVG